MPAINAQVQTTPPPAPVKSQDQVTVTANRSAVPIGETAKTTSTLTSADLHDYPSVTLDESLSQHAGFELFRRAGSRIANPTSDGISLRGLGSTAASRTLVLEDGAPLNDPFGGWINWTEPPQQTIRAVEIVTGGGSDLYGSSALGGVIDVIPETPDKSRFETNLTGGAQDTSDLTATLGPHHPPPQRHARRREPPHRRLHRRGSLHRRPRRYPRQRPHPVLPHRTRPP